MMSTDPKDKKNPHFLSKFGANMCRKYEKEQLSVFQVNRPHGTLCHIPLPTPLLLCYTSLHRKDPGRFYLWHIVQLADKLSFIHNIDCVFIGIKIGALLYGWVLTPLPLPLLQVYKFIVSSPWGIKPFPKPSYTTIWSHTCHIKYAFFCVANPRFLVWLYHV